MSNEPPGERPMNWPMSTPMRDKVLGAAFDEAVLAGWGAFKRGHVASRAGVSDGTVNNAFGNMDGLRAAVMREAVRRENLRIIAAGLAVQHPDARAATPELRERAARAVLA